MHNYELRHSRLRGFNFLCMSIKETGLPFPHTNIRNWCLETFGPEGNKDQGRWYDGLLGFYFKNREDAVQFILTWG